MSIDSWDDFIKFEFFSRDTIDVKRCYVDIAADLTAGVLLSQLIFWHLPAKNGNPSKLTIFFDNRQWIAKGREDWWDECRLAPKQFDKAIGILEKLQIVTTAVKKFAGNPTVHISLNKEKLLSELNELSINGSTRKTIALRKIELAKSAISIFPIREEPISLIGNIDIADLGISSTKITSKKTTKREEGEPNLQNAQIPPIQNDDFTDTPINQLELESGEKVSDIISTLSSEQPNKDTGKQSSRSTRIPDPFVLPIPARDWAITNFPDIDWKAATRRFKDHYLANGVKMIDWVAAWRNWIRKSIDFKQDKNMTPPERKKVELVY